MLCWRSLTSLINKLDAFKEKYKKLKAKEDKKIKQIKEEKIKAIPEEKFEDFGEGEGEGEEGQEIGNIDLLDLGLGEDETEKQQDEEK